MLYVLELMHTFEKVLKTRLDLVCMILKLMQDNERIYKLNIYNNPILSCIKFTDSEKNSQIGFLENRIR